MNEEAPRPHESRYLVWTDHRAGVYIGGGFGAAWFWSASGPRGHMSGAESTAEAAKQRAYAAFHLLAATEHKKQDCA